MERAAPTVRPAATSTRLAAAVLDFLVLWAVYLAIAVAVSAIGVAPSRLLA